MVAADLPEAQATGLARVVGDRPRWVRPAVTLGDAGAASAAFLVAAVLSHAGVDPTCGGRLALVASVDREGLAGVAALRLPGTLAGGGSRP